MPMGIIIITILIPLLIVFAKPEKYVNSESTVTSKPVQEEKVILWFFSGVFGYAAIYTIGKYVSEK